MARHAISGRADRFRHLAWLAAALSAALSADFAAGDVPGPQQAEVAHLLEFIASSSCSFERNGRSYGGERALRHVQRKYDYFRDEIRSTEDFIELAATRSTLSGKPYHMVCNGESRESRTVLLGELGRFRAARGSR